MDARQRAFQEIPQQLVGILEAAVVGNPDRADVHRQFAPAPGEEITSDQGVYSMRLQEAADQVSLGHVPGVVHAFHRGRLSQAPHRSNHVCPGNPGSAEGFAG